MNCPHCNEELGLNNICINPACSYFGTIIKSSENSYLNTTENSHLNNTENTSDNKNSYTNKSNPHTSKVNPNFNNKYNNKNDYTINSYDTNQNINKTNDQSFNISDNVSSEEFAAFIGSHNTDYYADYTHRMENNNKFISWNWACFFLGPYWLLYRKLYAFAAILFVVTISLTLIFHSGKSSIPLLLIRIILTIFANAIYLNNAERKIRTVRTIIANLTTTQYINRLHKKGGVNLVAPLVILVIYIVFILIAIISVALLATSKTHHSFSSPSYNF